MRCPAPMERGAAVGSTLTLNWQQIASFWVGGEPVAQPRPRARAVMKFSQRHRCKVPIATVYNPSDADDWKRIVAACSRFQKPALPLDGAVRVDIVFYLPRPKYMYEPKWGDGPVPHLATPDIDNLFKAVADAMTSEGWWRDDAHVCVGETTKLYHGRWGGPGAQVTVSVLEDSLFTGASDEQ